MIHFNLLIVSVEFSVDVSSIISSRGSNATFKCPTMGSDEFESSYVWMLNETVIGVGPTLVLMDINAYSGGNYTCVVNNAVGTHSASATLYVVPYIITPLDEQIPVVNGSNLNISCTAAGFPSPTVIWVNTTNMETLETQLLDFTPVLFGDEGLYQCVANAEINGTNFTVSDETTLVGR